MLTQDTITAAGVVMEAAGEQVLLIQMGADGSVSRQGTGAIDSSGAPLVVGQTDPPLFDQFHPYLTDELIGYAGVYDEPDPKGTPVKLIIILEGHDEQARLEFNFGSQSRGVPESIYTLASLAVEITEDWYQSQQP